MVAGRFKELVKKYGKLGLAIHFSVSATSITGLYVAIKNNVDVESMLEKVGMPSLAKDKGNNDITSLPLENLEATSDSDSIFRNNRAVEKERNRTAELAASSGGALALAVLINKALFPIRVPITFALTPPVSRFLARYSRMKNSV